MSSMGLEDEDKTSVMRRRTNENKLFESLTTISEKIGKLQEQGESVKEDIQTLTKKVDAFNNVKIDVGNNKERSQTNRRIMLIILGGLLSAVLLRLIAP